MANRMCLDSGGSFGVESGAPIVCRIRISLAIHSSQLGLCDAVPSSRWKGTMSYFPGCADRLMSEVTFTMQTGDGW